MTLRGCLRPSPAVPMIGGGARLPRADLDHLVRLGLLTAARAADHELQWDATEWAALASASWPVGQVPTAQALIRAWLDDDGVLPPPQGSPKAPREGTQG